MVAWYLVIALCLVDGVLCHEIDKPRAVGG